MVPVSYGAPSRGAPRFGGSRQGDSSDWGLLVMVLPRITCLRRLNWFPKPLPAALIFFLIFGVFF